VVQETRLYDPDADETRSMRSKEDAHDYRYFPDPDLPALVIEPARIEAVRASMPELPAEKRRRYQEELGLNEYDARALTVSRETADYFEAVVEALRAQDAPSQGTRLSQGAPSPQGTPSSQGIPAAVTKTAANWIMVDLAAQLNRDGLEITDSHVSPAGLARLVQRVADGTVSGKTARDIFQALWTQPAVAGDAMPARDDAAAVDRIIDEKGLRQISDSSALEPLIDRVLAENDRSVQEFRAGKQKAFNALVGQVMKASKGKANPQQVNDLLRARLAKPEG
jgi:aspartyl-tRNA(Asn)/glutamyl-tRNA(Gln) amidotransferase subunit B